MIVINGGAGFLGSNLVHALNARGYDQIIIVDRLGNGEKWRALQSSRFLELIPPEAMGEFLANNISGIEAVVQFGGAYGSNAKTVDALVDDHFRLSAQLWDWCAEHRKKFFYASSVATYGMGEHGFEDTYNLDYLNRLRPVTPFGFAKHMFDRWVAQRIAAGEPTPTQFAGLKFFSVFGPHDYNEGGNLVPRIFSRAALNEPCDLYKSNHSDIRDGGQVRDFIWVDDAMDVLLWLFDNPKVSGLFNVGTGEGNSFFNMAEAVYNALYRAVLVHFADLPPAEAARFMPYAVAKMDRLRAAGYTRKFTPLSSAIQTYVQDYLAPERLYR